MFPSIAPHLLDSFPLVRASTTEQASLEIGRAFSAHQLSLNGADEALNARHNQVRLVESSLNVLSYGAGVTIDPGQRGDFYLIQVPLKGTARLQTKDESIHVDADVLSVLQPHGEGCMHWSSDCQMLLFSAPTRLVERRFSGDFQHIKKPQYAATLNRQNPGVAAWCQAAMDITHNLDRFGSLWLSHQAATASMEEMLLSAFAMLMPQDVASGRQERNTERCVRRAKEYIQAHLDRALTLGEIAEYACVSARTLESAFQRYGEVSPLSYAREQRLNAAHEMLIDARRTGRPVAVTEVALHFGFVHLGRFAEQYRKRFGCTPSETLKPRATASVSLPKARHEFAFAAAA